MNTILLVLRLSYHHLPLDLRQCFAYCAVFPKDTEMEKEKLISLWMAHGFLSSKGNLVLEDVGNEVWNELYLRSFFQEIKVKSGNVYFKVHDLATSLFSPSASSSNIREINAKSYTHKMSIGFAEVLVSSYSPSLLKSCVSLRVLNLSKSKLGQLPSSIGDLVHLRYLDLSRNIFRSLPENLCKLQNLQTLNLLYCVLLSCLPKQTSKHSIFYFRNLKGLLKKEGEEQFPVLEEIKIYGCPMFVFPTLSSVKKLVIHKEADATGFRSIYNLTTLTSLYMYTNYEATSLPEEMFKSLANLKYLKISYYYRGRAGRFNFTQGVISPEMQDTKMFTGGIAAPNSPHK